MNNSHWWFYKLPYSAFYRFLRKSGICAKNEKIRANHALRLMVEGNANIGEMAD
jgi:hypothetical protein